MASYHAGLASHMLHHHEDYDDASDDDDDGSDSAASFPHTTGLNKPPQRQHQMLLKRQRGSGIEYLMQQLQNQDESSLSDSAKGLLRGLLSENDIALSTPTPSWVQHQQPRKKRKPIETSMSDERVMQLAQEGELSFLASLLKVIEEEGGTITTKFLIKACCLAVEPARVPSLCDAKEMVMFALHFLSQSFRPESDIFPTLPLIRCVYEAVDLEKRSYERLGDWTMRDHVLLDQVLQLEHVFYNSIDYKFLAREQMCPTLPSGRDLLMLKGSPPAHAMGKTKKAVVPRRKKTDDNAGSLIDDGME